MTQAHSAKAKAPRNSFIYIMYLSHRVRLCVQCTQKGEKSFRQSWTSHSTHLVQRGLSLFLALGHCFLPCPHLKRVSKTYSQLGTNVHVRCASTGCRKARRRNTHNPLKLHTYSSEAPGMETHSIYTSPRKLHFPQGSMQWSLHSCYMPYANAESSGGGNWIWYLLPT